MELDSEELPIERRGLTGPSRTTERITLDELLAGCGKTFDDGHRRARDGGVGVVGRDRADRAAGARAARGVRARRVRGRRRQGRHRSVTRLRRDLESARELVLTDMLTVARADPLPAVSAADRAAAHPAHRAGHPAGLLRQPPRRAPGDDLGRRGHRGDRAADVHGGRREDREPGPARADGRGFRRGCGHGSTSSPGCATPATGQRCRPRSIAWTGTPPPRSTRPAGRCVRSAACSTGARSCAGGWRHTGSRPHGSATARTSRSNASTSRPRTSCSPHRATCPRRPAHSTATSRPCRTGSSRPRPPRTGTE